MYDRSYLLFEVDLLTLNALFTTTTSMKYSCQHITAEYSNRYCGECGIKVSVMTVNTYDTEAPLEWANTENGPEVTGIMHKDEIIPCSSGIEFVLADNEDDDYFCLEEALEKRKFIESFGISGKTSIFYSAN